MNTTRTRGRTRSRRTDGDAPSFAPLAAGTFLGGRYDIGRVIGRGGFGMTYLAYDRERCRTVAVKEYFPSGMAVRSGDNVSVEVLASQQEPDFISGTESFLKEAGIILAAGSCPDIPNVYDSFRENGTAYYSMEFIKGITLKEYVKKHSVIRAGNAVYVAERVSAALKLLHGFNILHRDVSPDNIMICADGSIKLLDFGAARQLSDDCSNSLSVVLKQGFAPLEQYQRKGNQGSWTDIYSLGASLYYAVTGLTPEDPMTRLDSDAEFEKGLQKIPAELRGIIEKACAVRPAERYESADELISAIGSVKTKGQAIIPDSDDICEQNEIPPPAKKGSPAAFFLIIAVAAAAVCAGFFFSRGEPVKVKIGREFYPVELESLDLSNLELSNASIANLKHFKNLKHLNLEGNYITDLSVISGLTQLESVHFNNNNVSDLSFLAEMKNLRKLSAENNSISDISVLADKTELEEVFLGNNLLTDISAVSGCKKLVKAGFIENQISSINALCGMDKLEMVCLSGCGISDISPLKDSRGLRFVYLGRNGISDFSALKNCESIEELYLDNNPLTDESVESFAGITVNGAIIADSNGLSDLQADRLVSLVSGSCTVYY